MEFVIEFPHPGLFRCQVCIDLEIERDVGTRGGWRYRGVGEYQKHLRKKHPGHVRIIKCAVCGFIGSGAYPLKAVKLHYAKTHGDVPGAPQPSGSRSEEEPSAGPSSSGGGAGGRVAAARSPPAVTTAAAIITPPTTTAAQRLMAPIFAASNRRTVRPPVTAAAANTRSASRAAAVAAQPPSTTAGAATAPRRSLTTGRPSTGARPPATTSVPSTSRRSGPQDERRRPAIINPSVPRRPPAAGPCVVRRSGGTTITPPQRTSPRVSIGPGGARRSSENAPPRRSPRQSPGSGGRGGIRRTPPQAPQSTYAGPTTRRRAASVPVEDAAIRANNIIGQRTRRVPGSGTSRAARPPAAARRTPGTEPATTTWAGIVAGIDVATTAAARGVPVARQGLRPRTRAGSLPPGAAAIVRSPPTRDAAPRMPPTTRGSMMGAGRMQPVTTMAAATLTTTTVTTSCSGGPIMTTRAQTVGRIIQAATPPTPPVLPTIDEVVPSRATHSRIQPPSREPGSGSDEGEPWRAVTGRRARRALRSSTSASSGASTSRSSPQSVFGSPSPPPATAANYPPLPSAGEQGRRRRGRREAASPAERGEESGESNLAPCTTSPDVPLGTMAPGSSAEGVRRARGIPSLGDHCVGDRVVGTAPSSGVIRPRGQTRQREPATGRTATARTNSGGGGEVPERVPNRRNQRRGARVERDALVQLAIEVASWDELEELATKVTSFFQANKTANSARGSGGGAGERTGGPAAGGADGVRGAAQRGGRGQGRRRDDRPLGESERDHVRAATRIQRLFRQNRRRAVQEVLQGRSDHCQVQSDRVQEYFEALYSRRENLSSPAPVWPLGPLDEASTEALVAPFSERHVDRRIRRMTNSAPGPDGVTYADLRGADPGSRLLAAVINACNRLEAIPTAWKNSNTVLVYKKGDRNDLSNWRPLAMGDTVAKLLAALYADRLTSWALANGRISPAQKGFLQCEGCYEHNFVLQEILTEAKRRRKEVSVAWLDLTNAFGSIPHAAILHALEHAGVPSGLLNIWESMYDGCTTRVRTAEGYTGPIPIRSGVRQGCPLSPITFNLAIEPVLRAAADSAAGFTIHGQRYNILAYADDLALISDTPEGMRDLLKAVEDAAGLVGLKFNPSKCATLHEVRGSVLPTRFILQGEDIRPLAAGEPYMHLGVPTGFQVRQTPVLTVEELIGDLRAVDSSRLAPWQKLETVAAFLLPRLDFLLRGAHVAKGPLKVADTLVKRLAKSWMNLPQRASAEVVFIPPSKGGAGLLPLGDLADALAVAHAFRLLSADDAAVSSLAWDSLREATRERIGEPVSEEDLAAYLSGSMEGRFAASDGGISQMWSRARNAARRQSERLGIRWRWVAERGELVLECRGAAGRRVIIPPEAKAQVIRRLRSAISEYYLFTLLRKRDQGKVHEVSSRTAMSNHFLRGGSFTRFADWRFIHRARLDVLPLNGARRWGDGDKRCRRCGCQLETLPHVLGHCGPHSAAIQHRHNSVLRRLAGACRLPGTVRLNQRVEGVGPDFEALRPDLVVRHEASKSVVIIDVTVPFENRSEAFLEARARKVCKYSPLASRLERDGYRVVVDALVVGALGAWDPENERILRQLRVSSRYAQLMRRLIVSETIRWSRDIYVEHVSGVRQYRVPPFDGGGEGLDIPAGSSLG